ncbi:asparagine synthase (glutamine-hydrolyzing) [Candidatus Daviesbacteria bacterium]|nr:asparagine synthase (glutamine-hydrolyzing) [Candidatus Daviesbacteria bacterium]
MNFSSQPKRDIFKKSLDRIFHRGPDSSGIYIDKNVALGVRRLSIIDLSTGNQPISNENNTVTVVFNGEIYNFQNLREILIAENHKFKTQSDTETLVHLYEKYGENMTKYLNGMFAFAIWDKLNQKLFMARDPAGVKPLYFWQKEDKLIFGSELKTILGNPLVKREIDIKSLSLYTYFGYVPTERSIFTNIHKLLPGHSITFSKRGFKMRQYFKLSKKKDIENINLDNLFADAIKLQSVADVPLGVFLSGGLDSSLVTYYLRRTNTKVKTFSIAFDERSFDEGGLASEVAGILETKHRSDIFSYKDMISLFPKITEKLDEPLADPSLFPTFKVCKFARKYVKVVLSGDGGDELFGGYPTYQGHILAKKTSLVPSFLTSSLSRLLSVLPRSFENYPNVEILGSFLNGLHKPEFERQLFWMSLFSQHPDKYRFLFKNPFLEKELFNFMGTGKHHQDWDEIRKMKVDITRKMQLVDFNTYLTDDLLTKVDRASMFNSLEVRVPFLDPEIINFAFFTSQNHVDFFKTKKIIRKLLKNKLPETVIKRKKKGFGVPISRWIAHDLKEFTQGLLQNKKLETYFSRGEISKLWVNHQNRKEDNGKIIWMLVMFSGWLNNWGKE